MKVKVNDVELDLEPGTSAIDAVFAAGYDVPYFCSQEYMSPIGACRMCLAKVGAPRKDRETNDWVKDPATGEAQIFYFPNLMATCTTAVMDGMVIDTVSKEVRGAQSGMMEFTLINHPLDCPVCDKGGACELQDRAYEYGEGTSRFEFDKRHQEKHHALSELITLDRERCIHCKRCVRYFEEVPGDEVLDFIERGGHTYIGTVDEGLPSYFSGNITDMCPVGALLDSTSRFRGRNWEYKHTRTVSLEDASGAAIMVDARTGRIERVKGARNTQVNLDWIDDGTRFGHEYVDAPDRLRTPLIRREGGKLEPATWEEAGQIIKDKLASLSSPSAAVVIRGDATLEEGVAAKALAEHLGGQAEHFPRPAASVIAKNPATFTDVATSDAIFVVGDVTEELPTLDLRIKDALKGVAPPELLAHGVPIADLRLKERMPRRREILSVAAPYRTDLMRHAGQELVYNVGEEKALFDGLTSGKASAGIDKGKLTALKTSLTDAKNAVVILGGFVLASPAATKAAEAFAESVGAKVMKVGPMANSYGLEALAVTADKPYTDLLGSNVVFVSNLNPARDPAVGEKLKEADLLVVHDCFETETTRLADIVLPAKTGYEKEGTVVNLEGRFLGVNPAPVDSGTSEDLLGLVRTLGEALGTRLDGRSLRSARRALAKTFNVDLAALPEEGQLAPVAAKETGETPAAPASGNLLLTPSLLKIDRLNRNRKLRMAHGDAALRLNPADAREQGLGDGSSVNVTVGGVVRGATVRVTENVPAGLMLLPVTFDQGVGLETAEVAPAPELVEA